MRRHYGGGPGGIARVVQRLGRHTVPDTAPASEFGAESADFPRRLQQHGHRVVTILGW